ncbi:hypothetical protein T08_6741 [Trichinella sp. T8]|nr:hypothetical protein T08_6741 [Trichinella sp. T8]
MALDSTSFVKQWQKANPYLPQVRYRLIIVKAPDSSHIIKSPQAQRHQITVNRRILWEILDTDKRRLLQLIPQLTAVQARLNGVEFVEPADQDGSEEQEQSGRAKWLQQSSPDGDARFVRDTAAEGPEPRVLSCSVQNKRERRQKVIAGAKKVAFTLKLRLIHQPRQTVRYMVKHQRESSSCMLFSVLKLINKSHSRTFCLSWSVFLELESPLTSMPTGHCLSIRSCSQELSEQIL